MYLKPNICLRIDCFHHFLASFFQLVFVYFGKSVEQIVWPCGREFVTFIEDVHISCLISSTYLRGFAWRNGFMEVSVLYNSSPPHSQKGIHTTRSFIYRTSGLNSSWNLFLPATTSDTLSPGLVSYPLY